MIENEKKIELEKISSMLNKASARLMLSCFGHEPDMSDCRGAVYRKLKEKALNLGIKTLGFDRERVAYNIKIISDKDGIRCDRRTLPNDIKPWFDCPYQLPMICDLKDIPHGMYMAVISYRESGGYGEYPDEWDIYVYLQRLERIT